MKRRLRSPVSFAVLVLLGTRALAQSSAAASPTWIDYDGDGRIDLALLDGAEGLRLFRNEEGAFRDVAAEAGLAELGPVRLARWSDYDRDGRPDLLSVGREGSARLLRGSGGIFAEVDAGLAGLGGILAAEWLDLDGDGWSDLWVRGADAWSLHRNREGVFESVAAEGIVPRAEVVAEGAAAVSPDPRASETPESGPRPEASPRIGRSGPSSTRATAGPLPGARLAPPGSYAATFTAPCARRLFDEANGGCVAASSAPSLGKLYPLSTAFNVDPAGRVGIGTLSPTHRLTVSAPDDDALRLIGAGAFGSQSRLNFGDGDFVHLFEDVDDSLEIHTGGRLALTGGNVGIGTLSPGWPLHVVGTQGVGRFDSTGSTFGSVIELRNNTASPIDIGAINFVNALGQYKGQIAYTGSNALTFNVNAVERMRIDASGRVGIGTTLPAAVVDVAGSTSSDVLRVVNNGSDDALVATTAGSSGRALAGIHGGTGDGIGVHAVTGSSSQFAYGLFCVGNLGATGTKSFVQPHPSDPSKEVRFVCLEGNESGTYFRGKTRLSGGRAEIPVPDEFRLVSEPEGLTVQVSAVGPIPVWIESYDLERVVLGGAADVEVHYFVNGVRRGFAELECVRENHAYVPEERGVPYGTQYPDELRQILVENGTLNPDFTPSEATAARLGWELRDPVPSAGRSGGSR